MTANNVTHHHEVAIGSFETSQSSSPQSLTESSKQPVVYEETPELMSRPTNWLKRFLYDYNGEIGEFFAMMVFNTVGSANLAQILFRLPHSEGSMDTTIAIGWGCALILSSVIAIGTSGGHLNPAVTIGKAVFGHYPWKRVPGMVFAQTLGSFVGALFVWLYYYPMWSVFDGGVRQSVGKRPTAQVFVIQPLKPGLPYHPANLFFNEALMTFCMLFAVHFMADKRMTASTTTGPLMLGFMLAAVLYGGANINPIGINPARDFGPRLFILMAGWRDTFSAYNYYFYIPLLSPIVGGIAAQGLYDYLMIPTSIKRKEDRVGHH